MQVIEGRVFYRGALQDLCLGVEDGRIVAVKKGLPGEDRRSFGDDLILPGGIDLHVHFRDPGATDKEDFATGTPSPAIVGGAGVFALPSTNPPAVSASALEAKHRAVSSKANVDYGLYAGIAGTRPPGIPAGLAAGGELSTTGPPGGR